MTKFGEQTSKKLRTLCHSRIFDAQYEELNQRFDVEGPVEILEWLICQNPYGFPQLRGGYRIAETVGSINAPPLRVLFLVMNDDLVKLCFIEEQTIEELDENF